MAGLCEGGNEPPGSLRAIKSLRDWDTWSAAHPSVPALLLGAMPHSASLLVSSRGNESPKSFVCPRCGRGYKLKSSLRNHEKWECGMEPQFHIDGIVDSEMVFGDMKPRIRYRLSDIHFTVGENLGKTQPGWKLANCLCPVQLCVILLVIGSHKGWELDE
ncbi:hypothetical protein ANN_25155 [Periplaneta americana]|uniref:C2H2-type domain-containing protein n=1 Tax=Periplaneta americana TaxID=6978 RepID=A0ABQ8S0P6_PERAM|nr:hypothetical protein ANN_25155 [Periplaneta americana]